MPELSTTTKTLLLILSTLSISCIPLTQAQTASAPAACSTLEPQFAQPSVAPGWKASVVANGLTLPRGIAFDSEGGLLVVEMGVGISRVRLRSPGGCVQVDGAVGRVVEDGALNHGIALSSDGKTLYASGADGVWSWPYDASQGRNTSGPTELIGDFGPENGHSTRTLMMSRKVYGMLLVSRGSMSNLDPAALDKSTGVSTIKAFNISAKSGTSQPYSFRKDGTLLGWGLRNSVGVAEHPQTGGIYSVENSVDNIERSGRNIHQNNPGEEMNFHGYLNGTKTPEQGGNYGYPQCFAAWDVGEIPDNAGIQVGTQFAIGNQNETLNDGVCRGQRVAPRLTFAAHMAPLDVKFNSEGTAAWVTFHGSWNRDEPIGYKLSVIAFSNGSPTAPPNSTTAAVDILSNRDVSRCPDQCFRPVGLAWDRQGRLFMSSDSTGEIWVVEKEGGGMDGATPTTSSSGAAPSPSKTGAAVRGCGVSEFAALIAMVMGLPLA